MILEQGIYTVVWNNIQYGRICYTKSCYSWRRWCAARTVVYI